MRHVPGLLGQDQVAGNLRRLIAAWSLLLRYSLSLWEAGHGGCDRRSHTGWGVMMSRVSGAWTRGASF